MSRNLKSPLRLKDGVEVAKDAVEPLLRFLDGILLGVKLLAANNDNDERQGILVQLSHDLRFAAKVISVLDSSLEAAWTKLENTYAVARAAARGERVLKLGRRKKRKPRNAERVADLAAEAIGKIQRKRRAEPGKPSTAKRDHSAAIHAAEEWRRKVANEVEDALVQLGGSGSLTEILGKTTLSYAQSKKAIARLEVIGRIWRSGNKRSTRYHLT
jgi:hypothetical protein